MATSKNRYPLPDSLRFSMEESHKLNVIQEEFDSGFKFLRTLKNEVTFFGSARFSPRNKYYKLAHKIAQTLAKSGYTVITGGGGGVMEGANRGAQEAGGESVGLNIQLPHEQAINPYVTKSLTFHYFFSRKVILSASAQAFVVFPGGFGTMDELFEILALIQTRKMGRVPVILVGSTFWAPLITFFRETMWEELKAISSEDLGLYEVADTAAQVVKLVKASKERIYF